MIDNPFTERKKAAENKASSLAHVLLSWSSTDATAIRNLTASCIWALTRTEWPPPATANRHWP